MGPARTTGRKSRHSLCVKTEDKTIAEKTLRLVGFYELQRVGGCGIELFVDHF